MESPERQNSRMEMPRMGKSRKLQGWIIQENFRVGKVKKWKHPEWKIPEMEKSRMENSRKL